MTIPCHCLIAHPEKPKFLVIKHSDRWAPPILHIPEKGVLMYKPAIINQGMMDKYALRTTVLRIVMGATNYALIELELQASSQRPMQAIWMGREEYIKFRNWKKGDADPIEAWLRQRERAAISPLRAPWERNGWYKQAEKWISDRLVESGIQVSGSVQQFKAGWPSATLLRVATVQGQIFFKATYPKPPGEARLTRFLSSQWPDIVPEPLAVDEKRNWILMRDYGVKKGNRPAEKDCPEFARTLARLQVEAMEFMDTWRGMKCQVMDRPYLQSEDGRSGQLLERLKPILGNGPNGLEEADLARLDESLERVRQMSASLALSEIPDSLSPLDFRPDNYFLEDGKHKLIDWADVVISHPFFALCQTLDFFDRRDPDDPSVSDSQVIGESTAEDMKQAYLAVFREKFPESAVEDTFALTQELFDYFWLLFTASQLKAIEPQSLLADSLQFGARSRARALIVQFDG